MCKLLSEAIDVARTSVWALSNDGSELRCLTLMEDNRKVHDHGMVLQAHDFPEYFDAIKTEGRLSSEDVRTDSRTRNMTAHYFGPLGIIERKRGEEALRDSERRARSIFDFSFGFVGLLTPEGILVEANKTALAFIGAGFSDVTGKFFWDTPWWSHDPKMQARIKSAAAAASMGELVRSNATHPAKDGTLHLIDFTLKPILDENGRVIWLVAEGRDITEQKRTEEEQKKLQAQLMQAQKMEALGTFAGGIAHDFNNILTSVFGFTELAKMKLSRGDNVARELTQVLKAGLRARDLVTQILAFSRYADAQISTIDIRPLIKETLKFLKASIPSTIEIKYDLRISDATVLADPTQVHQIVMNLCANAAHAMREKGGVLHVSLHEVDIEEERPFEHKELQPGKHIQLAIADTGDGIPKELIDRIFEPFFTTKKRSEGTGLGLSVVHGIVKDMGGAISVCSDESEGTVFHVLIPRNRGGKADGKAPPTPPQKGNERILLVDDEETIVASGRDILESLGYHVAAKTDPVQALALFKAKPDDFDVVLTDMTMPKMTGIELSKRLMKIRSNIPIVLCTGFSPGVSKEMIKALGIRELVMKPMIISELAKAIRNALESGR